MLRSLMTVGAVCALIGSLSAQAVTFTGDTMADFPAQNYFNDPGGVDVGMPTPLVLGGLAVSGWDAQGVGIAYDQVSDVLFLGIDTFGIAGDADGDGNANAASGLLVATGGADNPNFEGTETFTFGLDLDNDGLIDVVAGIPAGADISGFTVAFYNNTLLPGQTDPLVNPFERFGAALPQNTGAAPTTPSVAFPDIQFTIPNFSDLLTQFAAPGQTDFGFFCFLGSQEDGGIGEDYVEALVNGDDVGICMVNFNELTLLEVEDTLVGADVTMRYGLPATYGCCCIFSTELQPIPVVFTGLPGQPVLLVGGFDSMTNMVTDVVVIDNGVPATGPDGVFCKDLTFTVPDALVPAGTTIYTQIIAYPTIDPMNMDFYLSNVLPYVHM